MVLQESTGQETQLAILETTRATTYTTGDNRVVPDEVQRLKEFEERSAQVFTQ